MKQYRLADASKAKVDASTYIEDVLFVDGNDNPVNVTGGATATPYVLPAAAENTLGGVKLANVTISGTANAPSRLRLPPPRRRRSTTRS